MDSQGFRRLALSLPDTSESSHMGHPDFRVRGKIFATLSADPSWGMVKLSPEQQERIVDAEPEAFVPVKGAWGRRGCTNVRLEVAGEDLVHRALKLAWRNNAPNRLAEQCRADESP